MLSVSSVMDEVMVSSVLSTLKLFVWLGGMKT